MLLASIVMVWVIPSNAGLAQYPDRAGNWLPDPTAPLSHLRDHLLRGGNPFEFRFRRSYPPQYFQTFGVGNRYWQQAKLIDGRWEYHNEPNPLPCGTTPFGTVQGVPVSLMIVPQLPFANVCWPISLAQHISPWFGGRSFNPTLSGGHDGTFLGGPIDPVGDFLQVGFFAAADNLLPFLGL